MPLALGEGRSELEAGGIAGVELRDVDGRACGIELGRTEEDGEVLGRLALGEGRLGAAEGRLGAAEGLLGAAEGRLALEPREPWNDDDGREALAPREEEPEEPREGEAELPLDPR